MKKNITAIFLFMCFLINIAQDVKTIKTYTYSKKDVGYILEYIDSKEDDIIEFKLRISDNYSEFRDLIYKSKVEKRDVPNNIPDTIRTETTGDTLDIRDTIYTIKTSNKLYKKDTIEKVDTLTLIDTIVTKDTTSKVEIKDNTFTINTEIVIDTVVSVVDSIIKKEQIVEKYDFKLYNSKDINAFISEMNNGAKKLHVDNNDSFDPKMLNELFFNVHIQLSKSSQDSQPTAGILNIEENGVKVEYMPSMNKIENVYLHDIGSCLKNIGLALNKKDKIDTCYESHTKNIDGFYIDTISISCLNNSAKKLRSISDNYTNGKYSLDKIIEETDKILKNKKSSEIKSHKIDNLADICNNTLQKIGGNKVQLKISDQSQSQLVFEEGTLANAKIILKNDSSNNLRPYKKGDEIIFFSNIPIGFTSKRNYLDLKRYYLYDAKYGMYRIRLSDVISNYFPELSLYTRDHSPADTSVSFNAKTENLNLRLMKAKNKNFFDIQLYSDFNGINKDKPNGLIQTEISYRININSFFKQIGQKKSSAVNIVDKNNKHSWSGFSYITSITPYAAVTKIEENGRNLVLAPTNDSTNNKIVGATQKLKLLEYNTFKVGFSSNLFKFHFPKLNWQMWNVGFEFGRVKFSDTAKIVLDTTTNENEYIMDEFRASTIMATPFSTELNFLPEERFRFDIKYSLGLMFLLSDKVNFVNNFTDNTADSKFRNNILHTIELRARYKLDRVGFLFARYRLNFQNNIKESNFHQAQVGISLSIYDILGRK